MRPRDRLLLFAFRTYKLVISPVLHAMGGQAGACRFHPSCSEYAATAMSEHGVLRGAWMAFHRVGRCHPFCEGGFDPVPPNRLDYRQRDTSLPDSSALRRAINMK